MDLETFQALLAPDGQAALDAAAALQPSEAYFLAGLSALEKRFPSSLAKAALETAIWRERARRKFSRAGQMYFTREALEQATGEAVARYRAARYAGLGVVADLGCGIGGDTLGLAGRGPVVAVDADPLRLAMARQNLEVYGLAQQAAWVCGDLTRMELPPAEAIFFDPARRVDGRRKFSVREYQPALEIVHAWRARTPAAGVKISPGVDLAELRGYDAEIEFISEQGELKECALWFGPLKTAGRRATLLPGGHSLTALEPAPAPLSAPRAYLYEPDPAVLRAGLVATLAAQIGASQLDPDIAYLTSDALQPTPYARAFQLQEAFPFQLKRLRARLRALGVGRVTVKKRGSPLEVETLIRSLKLPAAGALELVVFLTQVAGRPYVLLGQPA